MIEFQKRGLPHAHILIILAAEDKPQSADDYDRITCAEIPNPETQSELFELVSTTMIHTCSERCRQNGGKCNKGFPKEFRDRTADTESSYPDYRRRENGRKIVKGGAEYYNNVVVPYNAYLLSKYKCHINVEVCSSIVSVKYLYKYVYKGTDKVMYSVSEREQRDPAKERNEIMDYLEARYISASEAVWKIMGFSMYNIYPKVQRLAMHEPERTTVSFDPEALDKARMEDPERAQRYLDEQARTTLTAYFELIDDERETNERNGVMWLYGEDVPTASDLYYHDIPKYYVWNKAKNADGKSKYWTRRKRNVGGDTVGRLYSAKPNCERYFVRLLLNTVKGAASFEELRTVDDEVCETFQEACYKHGLLEDDREWDHAMVEAAELRMPAQLRSLYITILAFCSPAFPRKLYDAHIDAMSEDFTRERQRAAADRGLECNAVDRNRALRVILDGLEDYKNSLNLPHLRSLLPDAVDTGDLHEDLPLAVQRQLAFDTDEQARICRDAARSMNADQRTFFDRVSAEIDMIGGENEHQRCMAGSRCFFIDAPGGTGKTFVLTAILARVRQHGDVALSLASSGIAAVLLPGGMTAHSGLGLPIDNLDESSVCNIAKGTAKCDVIRRAKVVIWDEVSMSHRYHLEAFDRSARDLRNCDLPFGGLIVILSGDWRQCLPVVPRGSRYQVVHSTVRTSTLWTLFSVFHLEENMRIKRAMTGTRRAQADGEKAKKYNDFLLAIGNGTLQAPEIDDIALRPYAVPLPDDMVIDSSNDSDIIAEIFPDIAHNFRRDGGDWLAERAVLTPKNNSVDLLNDRIMEQLPGEFEEFVSIDTVADASGAEHYPVEFLNTIAVSGLPPHKLRLKVGAVVMLMRNLRTEDGLCNGTRLQVTRLSRRIIIAKILCGPGKGKHAMIPRIKLSDTGTQFPFKLQRVQFPLRPAFVMTINKSQGQTLKHVGIFLRNTVFSHGQLYVAFSRCGDPDKVKVLMLHPEPGSPQVQGKANTADGSDVFFTSNIVYTEVLGRR